MKKFLILSLIFFSNIVAAIESDKIFKIFTNDGKSEYCATAFFISETKVLTAAHTFEHRTFNHFILRDGKLVQMRMIRIDKSADIAMLEFSQNDINRSFFEFNTEKLEKGSQVSAIGFSGSDRFLTDLKETVKSVGGKIDCKPDATNGMSGCPLVDSSGRVVGMLVSGWGGTSHSIKAEDLRSFVDR